jgi:hypothetical protein
LDGFVLCQVSRDLAELGWKNPVDEQNVHADRPLSKV